MQAPTTNGSLTTDRLLICYSVEVLDILDSNICFQRIFIYLHFTALAQHELTVLLVWLKSLLNNLQLHKRVKFISVKIKITQENK